MVKGGDVVVRLRWSATAKMAPMLSVEDHQRSSGSDNLPSVLPEG